MTSAEYQKVGLYSRISIDDRWYLFSLNYQPLNVEPRCRCFRHCAFLQLSVIGVPLIEKHLSSTRHFGLNVRRVQRQWFAHGDDIEACLEALG